MSTYLQLTVGKGTTVEEWSMIVWDDGTISIVPPRIVPWYCYHNDMYEGITAVAIIWHVEP